MQYSVPTSETFVSDMGRSCDVTACICGCLSLWIGSCRDITSCFWVRSGDFQLLQVKSLTMDWVMIMDWVMS